MKASIIPRSICAAVLAFSATVNADVISSWDFYPLPAAGTPTNNLSATASSGDFTAIPVTSYGTFFQGRSPVPPLPHVWQLNYVGGNISLQDAITLNAYIDFAFQVPVNRSVAFDSISVQVSLAALNLGPLQASLLSSAAGFTTNQVIGSTYTLNSTNTATPQVITFSSIGVSASNENISFRMYLHGNGASIITNHYVRFGDSDDPLANGVSVSGSISIVPEVSQCAYLLALTGALILFCLFRDLFQRFVNMRRKAE